MRCRAFAWAAARNIPDEITQDRKAEKYAPATNPDALSRT
jgi:hypothetical protein